MGGSPSWSPLQHLRADRRCGDKDNMHMHMHMHMHKHMHMHMHMHMCTCDMCNMCIHIQIDR